MRTGIEKPNRNVFDLSFANNLTMKFGALYPVMCKEVMPGDSVNIDTSFGIKFMPMVFPVQTRMRADVHFFYVRNRNLWKDFPDFIGDSKEGLTPPFIQCVNADSLDMFGTGSLSDYLGVPSTLAGVINPSFITPLALALPKQEVMKLVSGQIALPPNLPVPGSIEPGVFGFQRFYIPASIVTGTFPFHRTFQQIASGQGYSGSPGAFVNHRASFNVIPLRDKVLATSRLFLETPSSLTTLPSKLLVFTGGQNNSSLNQSRCVGYNTATLVWGTQTQNAGRYIDLNSVTMKTSLGDWKLTDLINKYADQNVYFVFMDATTSGLEIPQDVTKIVPWSLGFTITELDVPQVNEAAYFSNPFIGADPLCRISALPYRAYESCYNSFYRNQITDPFKINGTPEYNKYIPTQEGGADTNKYSLRFRNWEQDFLTTAVPSPQQGLAPLLGMRQNEGKSLIMTYKDESDVSVVMKLNSSDTGELSSVQLMNNGAPTDGLEALESAIDFGISINDLRNVNSLQRWLEKNVSNGYRYRDQILSHFGVEVRFDELDMPEFLGGVSEDVNVMDVTQTVETEQNPLGSYAGKASCLGSSRNSINQYFDEHGFIIAILSVSPIPSYSQLLPKMFTKNHHLDYYSPEFAHVGMQPITYREVCPIQAHNGGLSLDSVFGYNRAWYDYMASVDEVHGQFRTTLKDFLINRTFETTPQLGHDFLAIDPNQTNDIFTVTDGSDDKLIGQVYFRMTMKRPIPLFGEPRLE